MEQRESFEKMSGKGEPILYCENLYKKYGELTVIENLNANLPTDALGLLGPNGSGKTTLIRMMLGLTQPTSGKISLNVPREGLRVVTDSPNLPGDMTIDQWIGTIEDMHGKQTRRIDLQAEFGLDGDWKIKTLSAGQKRKAALMIAFYGNPDLIILDEPTNFLDIVAREQVLRLLQEHIEHTKAKIIIATHRMEEVRLFCKDVFILKEGEIMRTVSLRQTVPQFYSLVVDDIENMNVQLEQEGILAFVQKAYTGDMIKVEASAKVLRAASKFLNNGGTIYSFEAVDELQRSIEELLQ